MDLTAANSPPVIANASIGVPQIIGPMALDLLAASAAKAPEHNNNTQQLLMSDLMDLP